MSVNHNYFTLSKITDIVKLSINQLNLLKYFYATCFGPLRPSAGVYKQQNVSTFITKMRDPMDSLPIFILLFASYCVNYNSQDI
jgi:hypothetical protein